jgi:hypothetical protein
VVTAAADLGCDFRSLVACSTENSKEREEKKDDPMSGTLYEVSVLRSPPVVHLYKVNAP